MLFSICLIISTNRWLVAWLALEINLLVFIPIILKKNRKYQTEARLKYFLIQATASVILLISLYTLNMPGVWGNTILAVALLIKIGAAPLHQWVVSVLPGLSWHSVFILLVPQKVGPVLLFSSFIRALSISVVGFFIVASSLVGAAGGLVSSTLKKIIVYSSVRQLGWILSRVMIEKYLWVIYFFVYGSVLRTILYSFAQIKAKSLSSLFMLKKQRLKVILIINVLSLGGMPPFSGFLAKIAVLYSAAGSSILSLMPILLFRTILSLFFYLRIASSNIFNNSRKVLFNKNLNLASAKLIFVNFMGLIVSFPFLLLLGFKLYKLKAFKALKKNKFLKPRCKS